MSGVTFGHGDRLLLEPGSLDDSGGVDSKAVRSVRLSANHRASIRRDHVIYLTYTNLEKFEIMIFGHYSASMIGCSMPETIFLENLVYFLDQGKGRAPSKKFQTNQGVYKLPSLDF